MIVLSTIRSLIGGLVFIVATVICSIISILLMILKRPKSEVDSVIVFWSGLSMKVFGVTFEERGRENLIDGPCLYLFNHTSFFDIFVMAHTLKGMRFGAKVELFKIPFFGRAMKLAGVLPITRSNREKVFRVYDRAKAKVEQGQQFALAPEGSRNFEEKLLPFKSGPFIFAINAQMPIVPVIIKGASDILPKHAWLPNWRHWRAKIYIEYLPALPVEGYTLETRTELQKKLFEKMAPFFPKNQVEAGVIASGT